MHIQRKTLLLFVSPLVILIAAAYVQWAAASLPYVALSQPGALVPFSARGLPVWLRITDYVNILFIILLIRSGLQILTDHARLHWKVHSTPITDWVRLTSVEVPTDRVWTTKDGFQHLLLVMRGFAAFIVMVISLVVYTRHATTLSPSEIAIGPTNPIVPYLGFAGIAPLLGLSALAYLVIWSHRRTVHDSVTAIVTPVTPMLFDHGAPQAEFQW
jgi:hypothetical protein